MEAENKGFYLDSWRPVYWCINRIILHRQLWRWRLCFRFRGETMPTENAIITIAKEWETIKATRK